MSLGVNSGLPWGQPGARCSLHRGEPCTPACALGGVRSRSTLDSTGADVHGGLRASSALMAQGAPRCGRGLGVGRGEAGALLSPCSSGAAMCPVNKLLCFLPGRMFIFYGNKTSTQFLNFTPTLICSDDLQANILGPVAPRATGRVGGRMDWEDGRSRGWSCSFRVSDCSQAACA